MNISDKLKIFSLILLLLTFIDSVNAQKNDPSVPMKIADEFKNDYEFEDALKWYEKVIQDFPDTLEAGNAILNKLTILEAQCGWYATLALDFLKLSGVQYDRASEYSFGGDTYKKLMRKRDELHEKYKKYERLKLQKGKALREEFYKFEKKYVSQLSNLSVPYTKQYSNREPPIIFMEDEDIEKILVLNQDSYLEYESREKALAFGFSVTCITYWILGKNVASAEDYKSYHKEYVKRKVNPIGFYYSLGLSLINTYQYQATHKALTKVIELAKDEPYNKLAYDAEKRLKNFANKTSKIIGYLKMNFTQAEIDEYVEPYGNNNLSNTRKNSSKEKEWKDNKSKTTEEFTVGSEWSINWTTTLSDEKEYGFFQIFVYSADDELIGIAANTTITDSGTFQFHKAGTYYLKIDAAQSYIVRIVETP